MMRLVLLLLFIKWFSHSHFERACSARQPDVGLDRYFVRPIMQIAGRIAFALQMFAVYGSVRENPSRSKQL